VETISAKIILGDQVKGGDTIYIDTVNGELSASVRNG